MMPLKIIVGTDRVGDTPVRHGTICIMFKCLLETLNRFFMVVCKSPDQATVKPSLRFRRRGGDLPTKNVNIEVRHDHALPLNERLQLNRRLKIESTATQQGVAVGNKSYNRQLLQRHKSKTASGVPPARSQG